MFAGPPNLKYGDYYIPPSAGWEMRDEAAHRHATQRQHIVGFAVEIGTLICVLTGVTPYFAACRDKTCFAPLFNIRATKHQSAIRHGLLAADLRS